MIGDMRQFSLGEKFDAIFIIREAFQFLTKDNEIMECLNCLASHLEIDGRLIIDLVDFEHNSDGRLAYWDTKAADDVWLTDWVRSVGDGGYLQRRHRQQHGPGPMIRVHFSYRLEEISGSDNDREWSAEVEYRKFKYEDFRAFSSKAGLIIEAVYGDYDRRNYSPGDPRLIFILKAQ